ncbi:MAG: polysaccharide biosynthesis/export family protein [Blastocatellia bacterium]
MQLGNFRSLALLLFACSIATVPGWSQTPIPPVQPSNQQPVNQSSVNRTAIPATAPGQEQTYRVGPGDVLDVRVYRHTDLSGERRVNEVGRIRLPFIEEFQAACLTEAELSQQIAEKYKKFLRDPQVDVFVKEYKSLPVAIIGAVNNPAQFQLQRRVRLLELLSRAGGPNNRAGNFIHIIHSNDYDFCQGNSRNTPPSAEKTATGEEQTDTLSILTALSTVNMRDLLSGKLAANLYVQPGDIISVPEADQIYITGAVNRPGAYPLTTKITLTQAIGLAGGINMEGAKNRVRLVRQDPNSDKRTEVVYNLGDITKRKIEDIVLLPNDIIEVPNSVMRAASRNMLGVSISMLSALPYFIIR